MAGATVASPLCTWLVAACMSMECNEERPLVRWSAFAGRRRRRALLSGGEGQCSPRRLISAFRGSGIQGLMSSFVASEPCAEFYSSGNWSAFFGENGFSLFGPWNAESSRRQRRATHYSPSSGNQWHILFSS